MKDVQVHYKGNATAAVEDVSFAVQTGTNVGIIGESGGGKSSIARAIVGLAPIAKGTVSVDGTVIAGPDVKRARTVRRRVQMVFQDAFASLNPRMTIRQTINEGCRINTRHSDQGRPAPGPEHYMQLVGMPASWAHRYPHELSGGQRQRVALARVLAVEPALVILDEATSALDVSVQAQILNLLKSLQQDLGVNYLVITHDLAVVSDLCDRVAVLYRGRIVEEGTTADVLEEPRHPYTQVLRDSVPSVRSSLAPEGPVLGEQMPSSVPAGCPFAFRCPTGPLVLPEREICLRTRPPFAEEVACHFPLRPRRAISNADGTNSGRHIAPISSEEKSEVS